MINNEITWMINVERFIYALLCDCQGGFELTDTDESSLIYSFFPPWHQINLKYRKKLMTVSDISWKHR